MEVDALSLLFLHRCIQQPQLATQDQSLVKQKIHTFFFHLLFLNKLLQE